MAKGGIAYQEIEGSLVRLELQGATPTLLKAFQSDPRAMVLLEQKGEMTQARLQSYISDHDLYPFKVSAMGKHIGYLFLMFYHGPVYCSFYSFDPEGPSADILADLMDVALPVFFGLRDDLSIHYYHLNPVPDEVHRQLVDIGWDPWAECPVIDNKALMCYIMWRHTYDAYYGEGAEDDEFEEYDGEGGDFGDDY